MVTLPVNSSKINRVINGRIGSYQGHMDRLTTECYNYKYNQNSKDKNLMDRKGSYGYTIHDLLDRYNISIQGATEEQVAQLANTHNVNIASMSKDRLETLISNARMASIVSGYVNKSYQEVITMDFNNVKELYKEHSGMMYPPNGVNSNYWTN